MYRLVLSSPHISLDLFFSEAPLLLRSFSADPGALASGCTGCNGNGSSEDNGSVTVISSARVPLVKWRFEDRVDVDITFARVSFPQPPSISQILCNAFLQKVSVETRPYVYGLRTCLQIQQILQSHSIPFPPFSVALRVVKQWASKRCVYNNLFTYPNGVVLSIMMTKVCLQLAKSNSSSSLTSFFSLLRHFFSYFSSELSQASPPIPPVYVTKSLAPPPGTPRLIPGLPPSWTPRAFSKSEELFPVINPAFPYANSGRFIGRAGLKYLTEEVRRAQEHFQFCSKHEFPENNSCCLGFLLQPFSFSPKFSFFVSVHFCCKGRANIFLEYQVDQLFQQWKGYLQSKIRIFIYALECVLDVRPYPHLLASSATLFPNERPYSNTAIDVVENRLGGESPARGPHHEKITRTSADCENIKTTSGGDDCITKEVSAWIGIGTDFAVPLDRMKLSSILGKAFRYFDASWRCGCVSSLFLPNAHTEPFSELHPPPEPRHTNSAFTRYEDVMLEPWWSLHSREEASCFLPLSES